MMSRGKLCEKWREKVAGSALCSKDNFKGTDNHGNKWLDRHIHYKENALKL